MRHDSVESYIKAQPPETRKQLEALRRAIMNSAPRAKESISYGMPYYSFHGRLAYFGLAKNHIGFYPMKSTIIKFKAELKGYQTGPGTVRFPIDKPLPLELVRKMVKYKAQENLTQGKPV